MGCLLESIAVATSIMVVPNVVVPSGISWIFHDGTVKSKPRSTGSLIYAKSAGAAPATTNLSW